MPLKEDFGCLELCLYGICISTLDQRECSTLNREITFPEYQPNMAGLQHLYFEQRRVTPKLIQFELIPLNDCLYRNIYRSVNDL